VTVHVAGAGLAGLAAAWQAARAGHCVVVHEAAGGAGGRCRSIDVGGLGRPIDNGTHVLLGANRTALDFLEATAGPRALREAAARDLPFMDLESGARWTVEVSGGGLRALSGCGGVRVPARILGGMLGLLPRGTVAETYGALGPAYARLIAPLALAIFNRPPGEVEAAALAPVLHRLARGGRGALRPHLPRGNLGPAWVAPILASLASQGVELSTRDPLRAIAAEGGYVRSATFGSGAVTLGDGDALILALPPWALGLLPPGIRPPSFETGAVVCAHFAVPGLRHFPDGAAMMGLTGGTAQWLARTGETLSVTVSAARDLVGLASEDIAARLWRDAASALGMAVGMAVASPPPFRVIKERRATASLRHRFGPGSAIARLYFAGGWTRAPAPDTIETAVLSGIDAAGCLAPAV
jgi:hypothetical protein